MTSTPMTKTAFLAHVAALYRVGNMADSDNPGRPDWVRPAMAGPACCAALDGMLRAMVEAGALSADDHSAFYDNV